MLKIGGELVPVLHLRHFSSITCWSAESQHVEIWWRTGYRSCHPVTVRAIPPSGITGPRICPMSPWIVVTAEDPRPQLALWWSAVFWIWVSTCDQEVFKIRNLVLLMSTNIFMTSGPNSWKYFLLFVYNKIAELSLWSHETNNGILADNTHHKWKKEAFVLKIVKYKEFSLVVQWLRLHVSTVGGSGSIPGWGTKIPHVTPHGQKKIVKYAFLYFLEERLLFLRKLVSVMKKRHQSTDYKSFCHF